MPATKIESTAKTFDEALNLFDFEALAHQRMSPLAWEYITSAAADEITVRWNRAAFDRIRLKPKTLVDVSKLDTKVTLFGRELPFPILLAPTALHKLVHPEGDVATARGVSAAGTSMVLSSHASTSVEDVTKAATTPVWFQLYVLRDRGFTRSLAQRAEAAGCQALCVTADYPVTGVRNREDRSNFVLPPGIELPNLKRAEASKHGTDTQTNEALVPHADNFTWKDVEWLRALFHGPVLLKGILNPDDADEAVKSGASGIIVSNHGGRNLDTVPATIDALPHVVDRVAGRIPVLMDGGVRRGTDVFKALANGANAVLIGRPYLHGLAVAGEAGVTRVVRILEREFAITMAMMGRTSLSGIDGTGIWEF
jgi:4-hydroxymandelate oxidase